MTVSNEDELEALKRIGRIVAEALEVDGQGNRARHHDAGAGRGVLDAAGARSAPEIVYAFPGATCISVNEEIAHGIPGPRRIQPGDLVNIEYPPRRTATSPTPGLRSPCPLSAGRSNVYAATAAEPCGPDCAK